MYILAIDTSNQHLGVALMKETEIIGEIIINIKKNHSAQLMPAIVDLLKKVEVLPEQLEKIVVAEGPGSYTGIRIGITTAKTMGWALNIPVVGVSSLKSLAYQGKYSDMLICPFFDARRGLVFTGLFEEQSSIIHLVENEQNILMTDWLAHLAQLNKQILFLSPNIDLYREAIQESLGDLAVIRDEKVHHIAKPSHLALIGRLEEDKDLHHLVPNYLRMAEAEVNWLKNKKETK